MSEPTVQRRILRIVILVSLIAGAGIAYWGREFWLPASKEFLTQIIESRKASGSTENGEHAGDEEHGHDHGAEDPNKVFVSEHARATLGIEVEPVVRRDFARTIRVPGRVVEIPGVSGIGLSVVYVEFDWDTDIYTDRQIVAERMVLAADRIPEGIQPQLAPISSIMGQIVMASMTVEPTKNEDGSDADATSMLDLRQLADWVVRRRLLTIPGVARCAQCRPAHRTCRTR